MEIFNTRRLTQDQRFTSAIIVGVLASLGIGILSGYLRIFIARSVGMDFSLVTIGATYLLALVIQKVGRGVQVRFSILGGILGVVVCSISNVIAYGFPIQAILIPMVHFRIFASLISGNLNTILMLAYQVFAVYIAYTNSRFI